MISCSHHQRNPKTLTALPSEGGKLCATYAGENRRSPLRHISKTVPDPFYFGYPRPEVVAFVPQTARRVLDIGCGAGRLGEAIKQRQQATVSGIELDAQAAAAARERLDHVWAGDIEQLDLEIPPGSFDAIVCADVLEHLREPARVLKRIHEWLAPDGCLVASIPNVRHHSVVRSLLQGNWTYESAGLLDRTHLRFFTRREIEKIFHRAGFAIEGMWSVNSPGDDPAQRNGANGTVQLGGLSIGGLPKISALRGGDDSVGLVGPRSNFVSGPQQIEVAYDNIAELDGFAWDFGKAQNGVMVEVSRLVGFCLLIKRRIDRRDRVAR